MWRLHCEIGKMWSSHANGTRIEHYATRQEAEEALRLMEEECRDSPDVFLLSAEIENV